MKFHIATFFGIPLFLHWTWFLMVPVMYFLGGIVGLAVTMAAFLFVTLHEYGHCLMAKHLNMLVRDVTLYPVGGLARLHFPPGQPKEEFLVALAGPAVNFVLAIIFIGACLLTAPPPVAEVPNVQELWNNHPAFAIFIAGFWINVVMLVFNMLPTFPMDGGRVFRATAVWITNDFLGSTTFCVRFSQVICLGIVFFGFLYGFLWLGLIFLLMFVAAQNELVAARHCTAIHNIKWKASVVLGRPELAVAPLPEVIAALEDVKDEHVREQLQLDELIPLLKDVDGVR